MAGFNSRHKKGYNAVEISRSGTAAINQFDAIARSIHKSVEEVAMRASKNNAASRKVATKILEDVQKRARFNSYSGNLLRSYIVTVRSSDGIRTYANPIDSAPRPRKSNYHDYFKYEESSSEDFGLYSREKADKSYKHVVRKESNLRYYELTILNHKVRGRTKRKYKLKPLPEDKWKYVKSRNDYITHERIPVTGTGYDREMRGSNVEIGGYKRFRYVTEQYVPYNMFRGVVNPTHGLGWQIAVGNYTPYRRFVEGRGFIVMTSQRRPTWEKWAKDEFGRYMKISLRQMVYRFQKGQKYSDPMYDNKLQPSGYVSPRVNAGHAHYDSETNSWIWDRKGAYRTILYRK